MCPLLLKASLDYASDDETDVIESILTCFMSLIIGRSFCLPISQHKCVSQDSLATTLDSESTDIPHSGHSNKSQ